MVFNLWTVITFAVILGCIIPIMGIWFSYKEKQLKLSGNSDAMKAELDQTRGELERANARIDAMGERVKVLERLATDQDAELARSLDRLKRDTDQPAA